MTEPLDEYRHLPLDQLFESPQNTRKHIDPKKQADLESSVTTHGILTPLLVRPNGARFEIGAGCRRYRAAKAVGLTAAPCRIRTMTDAVFLELITIENLQRDDIHPLDEAEGYEALLTKGKYDVARIAERVGKSVKYVYDRMKLLNLTPEAKDLFRRDKFTAGHAILLARLKPEDQDRIMDPSAREGLWEGMKHLPYDPEEENQDEYAALKPVSVRELQAAIDTSVRFDVKTVDPVLFPETAKGMKAAEELCEKVLPLTRDRFVHPEAKDGTRTYGPSAWKRADGQDNTKTCDHAVTGVIVVGEGRGESFKVCVDKKKCDVHWKQERREASKRAAGDPKALEREKKEEARRREEQEQAERARARWKKAVPAIMQALAERVRSMPTKATGYLAGQILRECQPWNGLGKYKDLVKLGSSAEDVVRFAAFQLLGAQALDEYQGPDIFPDIAKAIGLDLTKLLDDAAPLASPLKKGWAEAIRRACHHVADAEKRHWNPMRKHGATNAEILAALGEEWGGAGGIGGPDEVSIDFKGGSAPAVWLGPKGRSGEPTFKGKALAAVVREVLEIPEPKNGKKKKAA